MRTKNRFWGQYLAGKLRTIADIVEARRKQNETDDGKKDQFERFTGDYITLDNRNGRFDAPQRLAMPSIMTDERVLKYHHRADWQNVNHDLMQWAADFIEYCRKRDIPMYVHSAFRSKTEQDDMVRRKVSKARYPVAPHCQGCAVDIVHAEYHWQMTKQEWQFLGKVGKEIARRHGLDLVWGGDWDFYDPAHWELKNWRTNIRELPVVEPIHRTPRDIKRNGIKHLAQ